MNKEIDTVRRKKRNSWILFCVFLFVRFFFFEHYAVPSSSMTPTLITGDIILIKKYSYAWSRLAVPFGGYLPFFKQGIVLSKPKRGDIAVFVMERDPSTYYVKRIVGLEGDVVQMRNGVLFINGQPSDMSFAKNFEFKNDAGKYEIGQQYKVTLPGDYKQYNIYRHQPFLLGHIDNTLAFKVPQGYVWMQGDFHTGSADSFNTHFMGPIPMRCLVGKPFFVLMGSNSRLYVESSWARWIMQLPWRIFVWVKEINPKRFFVFVE